MTGREERITRRAPEAWEGCQVTVEHLIVTNEGGLGVGGVSANLEATNQRGIVITATEDQQEEVQFFPWASIIRIRCPRDDNTY